MTSLLSLCSNPAVGNREACVTAPSSSFDSEVIPAIDEETFFRNVWSDNLEMEMYALMKAAEKYPYIAMVSAVRIP